LGEPETTRTSGMVAVSAPRAAISNLTQVPTKKNG